MVYTNFIKCQGRNKMKKVYEIEKRFAYEYSSKAFSEYHNIPEGTALRKRLVGYNLVKGGALYCKGVIIATWIDGHGITDYMALRNDTQIRDLEFQELKDLKIYDSRKEKDFDKTITLLEFKD